MKRSEVIFRTALLGMALSLATPAMAQQAPPPLPDPATLPDDPVKPQVTLYEHALRQAVDSAGQQLAARAALVEPSLTLAPDRLTEVRGIHLENLFYFDVLIPDLNAVAMSIVEMMRKNVPRIATPVGVPAAAASERVSATGSGPTKTIVEPDPMKSDGAPTLANFNPTRDYSAYSREAIRNALIDLSGMLPIKDADKLTISASGFPTVGGNPLYPPPTRKLVVTITGADLLEFRQGKISRDEAKARIKESRY